MHPPSEPTFVSLPAANAATSGGAEDLLSGLRYAIDNEVARGGMGAILSARQLALQRSVAMKVMLAESADALRFVEEAQVTGQLEHPNIVPVHELGRDERGQLFYTMKFVRGVTLKKVLSLLADRVPATVKKYPLPALLTIFQKACDAIAFAHSRGVLHRDLKPENIMIGDYGEVLVMDWGLAKIIGLADRPGTVSSSRMAEGPASSTMAGTIMGTPSYMSPEQACGDVEALDERSDVYALGAILYEILALRPSVSGRSAQEVFVKVIAGEVARLPKAGHHDSLVAVVHKAMALDRAGRYRSVAALQEDVAAYQGGFATSAEGAGFARQLFLAVMRHKAIAAAAVIALCTGLAFGSKAVVEGRRAEKALAKLDAAVPGLIDQARALIEQQQLAPALEKIEFALTIRPEDVPLHRLRANYLQASLRLREAAAEYQLVTASAGDAAASEQLALCQRLLAAQPQGTPLPPAALEQLRAGIAGDGRGAEALLVGRELGREKDAALALAAVRLKPLTDLPEWAIYKNRIGWERDGLILNFAALPITDLGLVRDLPVAVLNLSSTKVSDLGLVRGLTVRRFDAAYLGGLTDLGPLSGLRLEAATLNDCQRLADFTPLRGQPIAHMTMRNTKVASLDFLRESPVLHVNAFNCRELRDIAVVRALPLKVADFRRCTAVPDFGLLRDCASLEQLSISLDAPGLEKLRGHPALARMAWNETDPNLTEKDYLPPAQFWAAYDAHQAAGKK